MKELNINNKQNKNKRKQRKLNFPPFFFSQAGTRKRTRRDEIKIIINIASTRATVSRTQWWPYKPVTILCALSLLCNCRRLEVLVKYGSNELRVIKTLSAPLPYTAATIYTLDRKYNNGKNENRRWNTLSTASDATLNNSCSTMTRNCWFQHLRGKQLGKEEENNLV